MKKKPGNHLERRTFYLAILLGIAVWVLDALLDYIYFYPEQSSFVGLLITDVPPHEIYIRTCIFFFFTVFGLVSAYYIKKHKQARTRLTNIFDNVIPICITDTNFRIISANKSYQEIFGPIQRNGKLIKCHDSRPGPKCKSTACPLYKITIDGNPIFTCESVKEEKDGNKRYFVVTATPYLDEEENIIGIIETFQDITARIHLEAEREKLIQNLQQEQEKVKMLSGFLPICASCKKIRDDKGYWNQIESYIKDHSEAEFSHGICPECAEKLYGNFMKKGKESS